jgi:cob(I)alamin adenosyltransferase
MYLNRLSDLLWALARWQDGGALLAKTAEPGPLAPESPSKGSR